MKITIEFDGEIAIRDSSKPAAGPVPYHLRHWVRYAPTEVEFMCMRCGTQEISKIDLPCSAVGKDGR